MIIVRTLWPLVGDREVQLLDGLALRCLAAAVVPLGRRHVGVPGHALHGADVVAGGEQIAHD